MGCNQTKNTPQDQVLDLRPLNDQEIVEELRESEIFANLPMNDDDDVHGSVQTEDLHVRHQRVDDVYKKPAQDRNSSSSDSIELSAPEVPVPNIFKDYKHLITA